MLVYRRTYNDRMKRDVMNNGRLKRKLSCTLDTFSINVCTRKIINNDCYKANIYDLNRPNNACTRWLVVSEQTAATMMCILLPRRSILSILFHIKPRFPRERTLNVHVRI